MNLSKIDLGFGCFAIENHEWIEKIPTEKDLQKMPKYSSTWHKFDKINSWKICSKCGLNVLRLDCEFDIFLLNNQEVYMDYGELREIPWSCEDMVIKHIIE